MAKGVSDFKNLEIQLGFKFKNQDLLKNAFVHRSYLNENHTFNLPSNERLEFLGDAVLEFLISKYLYENYPDKNEGDLTAFRSALVCTESLSKMSQELGFGSYLYLSKGEETTGGRERPYILANTFEAFLGAIYLDRGIKIAANFIIKHLTPELKMIISNGSYKDAKSLLQEITQEKVNITPHYVVTAEGGPDHEKWFEIGVFLENKVIGSGKGKSKQKAEQVAAVNALALWKKENS